MNINLSRKLWPFAAAVAGLLALAWVVAPSLAQAPKVETITAPQGGPNEPFAFTYQGRLEDGGEPANGVYSFVVELWTSETSGEMVSSCINVGAPNGLSDLTIVDGLFTFYLICDDPNLDNRNTFIGTHLWVQVKVLPQGGSSYTELPRQPITPTPYAWSVYPGAIISGTVSGVDFGDGALNVNAGDGIGVYAQTTGAAIDQYGVYGVSGGIGYGVYGHQINSGSGLGVYGRKEGGGAGTSGYNAGLGNGTWGYSVEFNGVGAATGRSDNNYGLNTPDNLYSLNFHTLGATMQVVQNGGDQPLAHGDVVAIAGLSKAPFAGLPPVIQVSKAEGANSTALLGVVYSTFSAEWLRPTTDPTGATAPDEIIPLASPGPVAPGEYLLVVVQGPCQVKVQAGSLPIRAGDLLSSAASAGHAARATEVEVAGVRMALPGTILGKALESLEAGESGMVYVFVTLR